MEIITAYNGNNMKPQVQNAGLVIANACGTYSYHLALKSKHHIM
jgi:hypothetical protein